MQRTLSIAMTTYNGERFLRQQLDSIYAQTKLPDEVVVCDDNSSDNTVAILEEYHAKYGLKYYVNHPGLGVNDNFYKAISLCSCDYIALSDQDDIWLPNKIELTYNKLLEIDDGKPSVVSSQCKHIDAEGNMLADLSDIPDSFGYAATLLGGPNSQGCSLMMNRPLKDAVLANKDANNEVKKIIFDLFISSTAAMIGNKYNLGRRLMLYRHHNNNVLGKVTSIKKKRSLRERVVDCDAYPGLIPDSRFDVIKALGLLYGANISDPSVLACVERINRIGNSPKFIGWWLLLTIKEICFSRKLSIMAKSLVVNVLKIFVVGEQKNRKESM